MMNEDAKNVSAPDARNRGSGGLSDEQRVKVRSLTKVYDAAQASTKHQERYVSSGGSTGSTKWVGSFSKLWAATVVANRQTLTLSEAGHEASNERRMVREAVAS